MTLDTIDVAGLDIPTRLPDLRRDLHVFVDYVAHREVKRAHRDNSLSKADARRLAKLMSEPDATDDVEGYGWSNWLVFVDHLALELGFVRYDTTGEYAGYTSQSPSFPDNYIEVLAQPYEKYRALAPAKQETFLLEKLLKRTQGGGSEFFSTSVLGRLESFTSWGSALGVVPTIDFTAVRRFLLQRLAECPVGQWLSTASLIADLKKNHRYFLIPAKPTFAKKSESERGRYGNFHEGKEWWGHEINIHDDDPDAFERVEGRYVERFLEGIPLLLRYVDVAYLPDCPKPVYPSLGCLKAFRTSELLGHALRGQIPVPRITVTPNFDVYVESEVYPAAVLSQLHPLCETVSEDKAIVLKLQKQSVAAACAARADLDPAAVLRKLTGGELPANVARELSAWSEHGEKFVLYNDCAVLESDQDVPAADPFTVERLGSAVRIVHSPEKLFAELERRELMPLRIRHAAESFSPLPKSANTRFPKAADQRKARPARKTSVVLTRVTRVQLVCPDPEFLDKFHRILAENKCPVELDRQNLTLSYLKQYESGVSDAIRQLKAEYQVEIKDTA